MPLTTPKSRRLSRGTSRPSSRTITSSRNSSTKIESPRREELSTKTTTAETTTTTRPSKLQKMITRSMTALVMFFAFVAMLKAGHVAVCFVLICLQTQAFSELVNLRYKEAKERDMPWFRSLQWAWFTVAMLYAHGSSWLKAPMGFDKAVFENVVGAEQGNHLVFFEFFSFGLFVAVFILSVLSLKQGLYDYQITQFVWTIAVLLLVVLQMKTLVFNIYNGLFWFVFPFLSVVVNDVSAYFAGITLGRKLFKNATFLSLSPNKTWEGFLGALVLTLVWAYYSAPTLGRMFGCSYLEVQKGMDGAECRHYDLFSTPNGPGGRTQFPIQVHAVCIAMFASLVAPFGGFLASGIKRATGIKDFNNIFPGHGGVVDRMDCQFIMCCFVHLYYSTFIASGAMMTVAQIIDQAKRLAPAEQEQLVATLAAMAK